MDFLILISFGLVGYWGLKTPTETLLKKDSRTGKWLYDSAETHEEGLDKARGFYNKLFGAFLICSLIGIAFKVLLILLA